MTGITTLPTTEEVTHTRRVPPYHVILLNDDHHSMEFVVEVLSKALGYNAARSLELMMKAHTDGRAVVYTGSREVAELKADQISTFHEVRERDGKDLGPLGCEVEPAPE